MRRCGPDVFSPRVRRLRGSQPKGHQPMKTRSPLSRYPREVGLIVMMVVFSFGIHGFASTGNLRNVLAQLSPILLLTVAQAFVLLIGGIDLSQGAAIGLYSITLVWLMPHLGIPGALFVCILIACLYG